MTERNLFSEIVEGFEALKNREWAGLTDEEVEELAKWADKHAAPWHLEFARAVETKLKEKNQVKGEEMTDLRQALAQEEKPPVKSYCGGKPNHCTPEVTPDVDAVNISQERVDETAKREHEPVEYTGNGTAGREADVKPTGFFFQMPKPVGTKLYTAPPKREHEPVDKTGSPCPEFWDWLPKAYNFDSDGSFTKYNMEVAFLAGQQSVTQQPPIAFMGTDFEGNPTKFRLNHFSGSLPLYTAPPKREWVGLTDEEIDDWFFQRLKHAGDGWALDDVVRAVQAKLKEKNT